MPADQQMALSFEFLPSLLRSKVFANRTTGEPLPYAHLFSMTPARNPCQSAIVDVLTKSKSEALIIHECTNDEHSNSKANGTAV